MCDAQFHPKIKSGQMMTNINLHKTMMSDKNVYTQYSEPTNHLQTANNAKIVKL